MEENVGKQIFSFSVIDMIVLKSKKFLLKKSLKVLEARPADNRVASFASFKQIISKNFFKLICIA